MFESVFVYPVWHVTMQFLFPVWHVTVFESVCVYPVWHVTVLETVVVYPIICNKFVSVFVYPV